MLNGCAGTTGDNALSRFESQSRRYSLWVVVAGAALVAAALYELAWQRYETFHNETFDLALYGRMAWGMVRAQFWDPVTNANTFGVHIMPILFPIGVVAELFGSVRALLGVQALALAGTAVPLFVIARRRLGLAFGVVVTLLWWVYPHIFHVASYEFHPGNLGVPFLMWACAVDTEVQPGKPRRAWWVLLALAVCCREDIALAVATMVILRSRARLHIAVAAACVGYFALFSLVAVPLLGPENNSVVLHFGQWGETAPEVVLYLLSHPVELSSYLFTEERVRYVVKLLGCLAFVPLLGPRWLLPAVPFLGMNLVSAWPSATQLDSHYQTLLLPFLFLALIEGLVWLRERSLLLAHAAVVIVVVSTLWSHRLWGGSPAAEDFEPADFRSDSRAQSARTIIERVPDQASVQAPYALMPHLLRRSWIAAAPPPDRNFDFVVLNLSARDAYRGKDTVLRTDEEPHLRAWLGRDDYGIVAYHTPYALVRRGAKARAWARQQGYLLRSDEAFDASTLEGADGHRLTSCLWLLDASLLDDSVAIRLAAAGPCDKDLAVRIGDTYRPARVDLLFDGLLNPAQLQAGDVLRSKHVLTKEEREGIVDTGLCIGAVRQSGVRPDKADPVSVCTSVKTVKH